MLHHEKWLLRRVKNTENVICVFVEKVAFSRLPKTWATKQQNNSPAVWAGLIPIPSARRAWKNTTSLWGPEKDCHANEQHMILHWYKLRLVFDMALANLISVLFGSAHDSETFPHRRKNAILTKWQLVWKCIRHTDCECSLTFLTRQG